MWRSTTYEVKMAGAQRALSYWTCVALAFGLTGKLSAVSVDSDYDQVSRACAKCDNQFAVAAIAYQNKFGVFSKAIDGAKFHCRNMANVSQCYANCQAGSIYSYSSQNKEIFDLFYRDYCDPACYNAIVPFCYLKTFGTFDTSLTCSGNAMNTELRECLKAEFFEKQNCSSACTPGQRKALYLFMQLQIPCFFSYTTQINCYTSVQYCNEKYFGDSGSDYSGLIDPILANSNDASCKYFSTDYVGCLHSTLSGTISFGESSSVTTYESPCQSSETQVIVLEHFAESYLAAPFCKARNSTFEAVCQAFVTTTTARITSAATAIVSPTMTTTTASTQRTATPTISTTVRRELVPSAAAATASSTSTITAARTAASTLTASTTSAFGTTTAANVLHISPSTTTRSSVTTGDNANTVFDKEKIIAWLNLRNSALSLMQLTRNALRLLLAAGLLLIHRLFPRFFEAIALV